MAGQRLLLLLDNCEHVIEDAARTAEELLRTCPELTVLATSREPLRIAGEALWRVPSLALPSPEPVSNIEVLVHIESVALFLDRARGRDPSFRLTPSNAPHVITICRQLDGIPLAIELAAGRISALDVGQIAGRLDRALSLLGAGIRTVPRQETLLATLDWSYALLAERERILLRRLAPFAGGFDAAAVEIVCGSDGVDPAMVLTTLADLVDKSLVAVIQGGDEARYRLLEMVRQYAGELLAASDETGAVRGRHARHYLQLAEQAEPELKGPLVATWLERLEHERDNLLAALSWFSKSDDVENGLRLAAALHQFLLVRGYHIEGRRLLTALLDASKGAPIPLRAQAHMCLGELIIEQADYVAARSAFREAFDAYEHLGDAAGMGYALWYLGRVTRRSGDNPGAREPFERSVALFREIGDGRGLAGVLMTLGDCLSNMGDFAAARPLLEESLAIFRDIKGGGAPASVPWVLGNLATMEGQYDEARALFAEAIDIAQRLADKSLIAQALEGLAGLASVEMQPDRALRLAGAADALRISAGAPLPPQWKTELDVKLEFARRALSAEARMAAWSEGQSWSVDEAADYAVARSKRSETASLAGGLTAREREVADLLARGMRNREIAAVLVISPETAAVHVKHILGKLGFKSRSQVAAWVVTQGNRTLAGLTR